MSMLGLWEWQEIKNGCTHNAVRDYRIEWMREFQPKNTEINKDHQQECMLFVSVNSAEFVTAVRSHRNSRKLNLDLSGNLFGEFRAQYGDDSNDDDDDSSLCEHLDLGRFQKLFLVENDPLWIYEIKSKCQYLWFSIVCVVFEAMEIYFKRLFDLMCFAGLLRNLVSGKVPMV